MNMPPFLNGYRSTAVLNLACTVRPSVFSNEFRFFFLWGCMNCVLDIRNLDTRCELLSRILDAAVHIKKREDKLRRNTLTLRSQVAKCIEVEGGILEYFLQVVTIFVIPTLN